MKLDLPIRKHAYQSVSGSHICTVVEKLVDFTSSSITNQLYRCLEYIHLTIQTKRSA